MMSQLNNSVTHRIASNHLANSDKQFYNANAQLDTKLGMQSIVLLKWIKHHHREKWSGHMKLTQVDHG